MTVLDANGEMGQEESNARALRRERQPAPPRKQEAPSALRELRGPGSRDRPPTPRISFTSRPAGGIVAGACPGLGAAQSWAPQKGNPCTPVPTAAPGSRPPLPARAGAAGCVGALLQRETGSKRVYYGRQ